MPSFSYETHKMNLRLRSTTTKTLTVTNPNGGTVTTPIRHWSHIGQVEEYELGDGTTVTITTKGK